MERRMGRGRHVRPSVSELDTPCQRHGQSIGSSEAYDRGFFDMEFVVIRGKAV